MCAARSLRTISFSSSSPNPLASEVDKILIPKNTWFDEDAYDEQSRHLARLFIENFEQYEEGSGEAIMNAGPRIYQS